MGKLELVGIDAVVGQRSRAWGKTLRALVHAHAPAAAVDLHESLMDRSVSAVQHHRQIAHTIAPGRQASSKKVDVADMPLGRFQPFAHGSSTALKKPLKESQPPPQAMACVA